MMVSDASTGSGLAALADNESVDEIAARYDEWAPDYERDVRSWGYDLPSLVADRLMAHDGLHPSTDERHEGLILDAGCGTGLVGEALMRLGVDPSRLVGVDLSPKAVDVAIEKRLYRRVLVADLAQRLPFDDDAHVGVVCAGVLTYLSDTATVLDELLRVTAPGGVVVFSQRTDLWEPRKVDDVLAALIERGVAVTVHAPRPYLPGHDEYGDQINVRITEMVKAPSDT